MLSYKSGQPIYDYFDETDLDNDDEQPIDFSKRYADMQDSYDTGSKKRPLSTPSVNSDIPGCKHPCNDEMKVYCFEGTPLLISSASSFCDLRDIGQNSSIKSSNSPVNMHTKNSISVSEYHENAAEDLRESIDPEGKEHENGRNVSRASSPLMFSRSSSLESLNSFEHQSIRDDRSSVSAFSTLASGIISPSEIPDSPGEVMSPFYPKKQTEFPFPPTPGEKIPASELSNSKAVLSLPNEEKSQDIEDDIKIYNDEGDFSSMSSFSSLSIRTSSNYESSTFPKTHNIVTVKVKSSIKMTTSTPENHFQSNMLHDRATDATGNCNQSPEKAIDLTVKKAPIIDISNQDNKSSVKQDKTAKDMNSNEAPYNPQSSTKYQPTMCKNSDERFTFDQEDKIIKFTNLSKDSSSDESDDLLKLCIRSGMPQKSKISSDCSSGQPLLSPASFKETHSHVLQCSDNDSSDEEDLIKKCIQMGMPQHYPNSVQKTNSSPPNQELCNSTAKCSTGFPVVTKKCQSIYNSNVHVNKRNSNCNESESDDDEEIMKKCIQLGMPPKNPDLPMHSENLMPQNVSSSERLSLLNSNVQIMPRQNNLIKSSGINGNANNRHIQQFIPYQKPNTFQRTSDRNIPFTDPHLHLGYRDNCPDGVSDGDDDSDILADCIRAGKPRGNSSNRSSEKNYAPHDKNQNVRIQASRKSPSLDDKNGYKKKNNTGDFHARCISPSNPGDEDSPCIYRTEDTPILSPTASISDLSTLSFNDSKSCLNNSRNSDCSSESDEDEILRQCIQSGMPGSKKYIM